ncbi:MAG: haloacid dehalogenase type II [Alphaproteobacteria bacterium]|nr:haloacid dehalogenase type II [Alphaproteobacteria bacterium]
MAGLRIKALAFDVFGTVVDWRNSIAEEAEALLGADGHAVDGQAFALAWRARYQPSMEEVRAGRRPFVKLDILHRENLLEVLQDFRIEGVSASIVDDLTRAWHRLAPWPDVVDGLVRLKRGHIIAPLSNGNVALLVNLAKHGGLPWDVILGAEVAQAYKPDPEAYRRAAALLDLDPGECLMVAAHNDDLLAAAATGMKTAFVARPDEYGPGQSKDLAAEHDVDVIAGSFGDLADQLGA